MDGLSLGAIHFTLNGRAVAVSPDPGERLSQTLRDRLGASEVKIGCNAGDCGACTVNVDGAPVCACLMATQQAAGCTIETVAGLVDDPLGQRLSDSFQDHHAAQCGICTPGMMVAAVALLRETPRPDAVQVQDALGGVLCRCTGYRRIIDAVVAVGVGWNTAPESGAIGTSPRRLDGLAKVAGTEKFGDDVAPAGALVVRVVRSPHPRAGFRFGDLEQFAATHGLTCILTAADIPGLNAFGVIAGFIDQPVFAVHETRFRGEAVAAVVAKADSIAKLDLSAFPVSWTPLPAVTDPTDAMAKDAPQLHPHKPKNIMCGGQVICGDAEAALARADVVVAGTYDTGFVEHAYIEPEAGFAQLRNGRIEISACTQAPGMDRESMALILGMDRAEIRIIPTAVGGGFGSKLDLSVQPYVALAALKTGRPCRITYSRIESMQSTTKRHPSQITARIGAMADGRMSGMTFHGDFNTGANASWGPTVATRVPIHASGPYYIADYSARSRAIYTHNPPAGAFRGFGVPQSAIAQEGLFDLLANKLGMDALEFRILNALDNAQPTVCGQVFDTGVGIRDCLTALRPAWAKARADCAAFNAKATDLRRGVGVAAGWYGCGNTSMPNPSTITCGLRPDGQVVLHQGATDIGQGSNTVITQIFAQALGVPVSAVQIIGPDTDQTPDAGKTSASRQTFVTGNAARLAGLALRGQILRLCNAAPDAVICFEPGQITATDALGAHEIALAQIDTNPQGYVLTATETYDPPTQALDPNGQGAPYAQFGYAAQLAVVEVDTKLGTIRPLHFTAAHDVGVAINPALVIGQVQGGIAQGLGMALMEEYIPGRTENLHDYLIPTIGDVPPIDTIIIEVPDAHGPFGAKGLGEHALIPTAPAILNAARHATGVTLTHVPATPSRVRAALLKAGYD